jgi:putative NIF3 family GTP cyclohydrolase 1 type 2
MSNVAEIIDSRVDLYVTGEAKEEIPAIAKEIKINYAAFGHYNTEKLGVSALGDLIKKQYPELDVRFIDVPCPL